MLDLNVWTIFGGISIVLLILFWKKKNAIWGGLTIGIIVGFLIAIVYLFKETGFNWSIIGKSTVSGVMIGFVAELLGMLFDFMKKK